MITFSESAIKKITTILDEEDNKNMYMRVFIEGGGCSGMQYGFTLDANRNDDDFEIHIGSKIALVDAASMQYLTGANIDYKEAITESRFIISNPNATGQCGCGSSFAI
jgi:iron-sulfur cluster insertion protein